MERVHGAVVRRLVLPFLLVACVATPPIPVTAQERVAAPAATLPARLSDTEYWQLVSSISEPGGYFRIADNFTSNEGEIGVIYSLLQVRGVAGGVYLGVGPEQNFTYIAAIRPAMAFIVDIRRQAVMQHLMFKAIFELAPDRAEFISMLFAKARPMYGVDSAATIQRIWEAFAPAVTDRSAALRHRELIVEHLTATHGFQLTPDEIESLKYVYDSFVAYGPGISTRGSPSGRGGGNNWTFVDLTGWATDGTGEPRSFLATEENYLALKQMHGANLIVPVSGDFGGPRAIRAIGAWVRERGGIVRAFYVSNVEQYLFQEQKERAFYENVSMLPVDEGSVFIRPYSLRRYGFNVTLCPIGAFIRGFQAGLVNSNTDALLCSQ